MAQPTRRQLTALSWIYFAYVSCYLLRKNFPLLLPDLAASGLLTTAEAGIVASAFETVVGIVKFFCGAYVDAHPDPAGLLASCLFVAAGSTLALYFVFTLMGGAELEAARLLMVTSFWSLNGAGQAVAWPALARVFMNWFPDPAIRGFWYSVLATNQNVGGSLSPRIYPSVLEHFGWSMALLGPAVFTLVYASGMKLALTSSQEEKEVVEARETEEAGAKKNTKASNGPGTLEAMMILMKLPPFLLLCFAYIPVMVIRISLANWAAVIFQANGMGMFEAGACMSALEVGGFVGGLLGGFLSDKFLSGRRGPIMCLFSLSCMPLSLVYQYVIDMNEEQISIAGIPIPRLIMLQLIFFCIGAASFPPHSLIGLTSRELVPANIRSTAGCVAKAVGQLGAAVGGLPLQQLAAHYGWGVVGYINAFCGVAAALIFLPLWSQKAADPKKAK